MIVQSFGTLQSLTPPQPTWRAAPSGSVTLYDSRKAYRDLYATQPNVRIMVDFLSRNVAQLAPHAFRRVSDTDRVRLANHQLTRWLNHPSPSMTRYRLIETLMADLGIYFEAFWLKVRYGDAAGQPQIGLVPLPPEEMGVEGSLLPTAFIWTPIGGRDRPFAPSEIVYFNGYNPRNRLRGLSPLETLSRILAEEQSAGEHREAYWRNSSKQEGVIERTMDAPSAKWTPKQKSDYREQFQERYTTSGAGAVAILEPGMVFKPASWSAKDSEYVAGGKLRREVCAAEYHIPQPMVGILDHATFSNIREQHKHTYQDTLAPWLEMIQQEIEAQLLIECDDQQDVYLEFNIAAKLAGSFEEQASSLQMLVGRPIMTANEGRARLNLPSHDDPSADDIAPQQGGPASASQPSDPQPADTPAAIPTTKPGTAAVDVAPVIAATRDRQHARLAKLPVTDRPAAFAADLDRWNRELATDLAAVTGATDEAFLAAQTNAETLRQLEADALEARVVALEQKPDPKAEMPPQTINVALALTPAEREKSIAVQRDRTGAVTGYVVK